MSPRKKNSRGCDDKKRFVGFGNSAPEFDQQRGILVAFEYLTNDLVVLSAPQGWYGHRQLRISGLQPIQLGLKKFVFVLTLARYGIDLPGQFVPTPNLLEALEEASRGLTTSAGVSIWSDPQADEVYRVLSELRDAVDQLGGNWRVFQSSPLKGAGVRLSTRPDNIRVEGPFLKNPD